MGESLEYWQDRSADLARQLEISEAQREEVLGLVRTADAEVERLWRVIRQMADAILARREARRCDPEPDIRREVARIYRESERDLLAAAKMEAKPVPDPRDPDGYPDCSDCTEDRSCNRHRAAVAE